MHTTDIKHIIIEQAHRTIDDKYIFHNFLCVETCKYGEQESGEY